MGWARDGSPRQLLLLNEMAKAVQYYYFFQVVPCFGTPRDICCSSPHKKDSPAAAGMSLSFVFDARTRSEIEYNSIYFTKINSPKQTHTRKCQHPRSPNISCWNLEPIFGILFVSSWPDFVCCALCGTLFFFFFREILLLSGKGSRTRGTG